MKPARIFLGIVVLVALSLAVLLFLLPKTAPKPLTYRGKNIDYWFSQLPVTPVPPPGIDLGNVQGFVKSMGQQYGDTNATGGGAIEAFNAFGTNAEPFLIARHSARIATAPVRLVPTFLQKIVAWRGAAAIFAPFHALPIRNRATCVRPYETENLSAPLADAPLISVRPCPNQRTP